MYPVSQDFKNKIQETSRTLKINIIIQHSQGVLDLRDTDIVGGSLQFNEATQSGEDFTIGGTVASDIAFDVLNKPEYADINWEGATVIPSVALEITPGLALTYGQLSQYTYAELAQYTYGQLGGVYEHVPLGYFNIDDYSKQRNTISIKAMDNIIRLDVPYSLSKLSYPATLYQIYVNACNACDIQVGTAYFPNMDYIVQTRPEGDYSFRDIVGYVAELAGGFAQCNRAGQLEIRWYESTGLTINPQNRFKFTPREDTVQITGVGYVQPEDEVIDIVPVEPLTPIGAEVIGKNYFVISQIYENRALAWASGTLFTEQYSLASGFISCKPGEKFTLEFIGKSSINTSPQTFYYNKNKEYIGASASYINVIPNANANYSYGPSIIPEDTIPAFVRITFRNTFLENQTLEGYKIKLEKGSTATDWTPAPEDIYASPADYVNLTEGDNGVTYLAGTDGYVVDLTNNPLLQTDIAPIIASIYYLIKPIKFIPYESNWQGNPAVQAGDIIKQVDRDGKTYNTLVTSSTYKYRGACTLAAKGLPLIAKGYKGSTNKKITNIIRKTIKPVTDQLTTLQQAQIQATELIANMLGGYAIQQADALYVADNPDLQQAAKVWKWGLGGFGYSSTGVNGPYTTAITADGSIVAMLVAANIVTANMIQTGVLQSEDGSTWINLEDGSFNFKNILSWINGSLNVAGLLQEDRSYNGVTINAEGIRVENEDQSHTTIDGRGINRVLSIPIYADNPTGTDVIEGFESGQIEGGRISLSQSRAADLDPLLGYYTDVPLTSEHMQVVTAQKHSGTYGLRISSPLSEGFENAAYINEEDPNYDPGNPWASLARDITFDAYTHCRFLNYSPSKNTTFTMWYKKVTAPYTTATLYIDDLNDTSRNAVISLTNTDWSQVSYAMLQGHMYLMRVVCNLYRFIEGVPIGTDKYTYAPTAVSTVYIDDVVFEEDVTQKVIVGYEEGTKAYDPFFYLDVVPSFTTAYYEFILPEYFRGLNYRVFSFHSKPVVSRDKTVPNVIFQNPAGEGNPSGAGYFIVTL